MERVIYYLLEYSIAIGFAGLVVLCHLSKTLFRYAKINEFKSHLQNIVESEWRGKCLEHVVEKINVTNSMLAKKLAAEDVVAKCIYNYDVVQRLGAELSELFSSQHQQIRNQYPSITNLDLLVLTLLSIDMSNSEICSILRMERRTLYRRRQLIGQRMGVSSEKLETLAKTFLFVSEK